MTAIERAFHEKWIKGITLKMIWGFLTLIITMLLTIAGGAYEAGKYVDKLEHTITDGNIENRQFTKDQVSALRAEVFAKFDTIKINQVRQEGDAKLENEKTRHERNFSAAGNYLSAYKDANGHLHFYPVRKP